ncbi:hypothetical protein E6H36_01630 [Candidatus Bathyarchaeota archaeon]|nr:MAG: hypothetical protein E6H36_01630 [Candidatus Bathyarchaeota archaeon]TMI33306.1 MAG: hypothetical protein E6H29_00545 [Candidatus Bathyarchaeota archaeon]
MSSPFPKPGESVKVTLMNGDVIEGAIEWIDGNGAWVKGAGAQKSRWVPLESLLPAPAPVETRKEKQPAPEE